MGDVYIHAHIRIYVYTHKHTDMKQWLIYDWKKLQNGIYIQNGPILKNN